MINAYASVLAVLLITAGRLGDLLGQRTVFFAGIALFTVASVACGLAPSAGYLIAFRAVQGLGAALLMPQTLAILTMVFPAERRGAAFGVWGAVAGVATIAGPTLGGLLVTAFDWRYIFFINLPVGIAVLGLTFLLIPDLRTGRRHSFDVAGVLLASGALLAICYALVEGQKYNWGTIKWFISIPLLLAVGDRAARVFVFVQARRQGGEPLVPFALFQDRNYALMNLVSGFISIGMLGIFLPFSIYLQDVLGFSALKAGLTMAPASVVAMFVAPVAGRMSDRIGGKYILMTGLVLFAGGMGGVVLLAADLLRVVHVPRAAAGRRRRHRLHVRAADHDRAAQHQPDDGGRGVGRVQHHPAGRHCDRHRGCGRPAAEPAGRRLREPGAAAGGSATRRGAAADARAASRQRPRAAWPAVRPSTRTAWRPRSSPTASCRPCGRPWPVPIVFLAGGRRLMPVHSAPDAGRQAERRLGCRQRAELGCRGLAERPRAGARSGRAEGPGPWRSGTLARTDLG